MLPEQWEIFKRAARLEKLEQIPLALIVDSPWIPGYLGINHMDYYLDPELWFQSNLKIMQEFPDIIFVPSWWMEYGMAAEPSVLGREDQVLARQHAERIPHALSPGRHRQVSRSTKSRPTRFAALTLHRYGMHKQRILDHGYILPMVTSRGPLCTAGFVRGTTDFMIDLVENPEGAHKLIDLCTRVVIDWLKAQHKVMGDTVEGIFILDDIVGFINEEHYLEFAHPYLKRICDAFPDDWVKIYHNDAEVDACLDHLPDAGFNVLNWGKQKDIREVKQRVGDRMCLMGNVNPLEIGVRGTPDEVRTRRSKCSKAPAARGSSSRSAAARAPACRAKTSSPCRKRSKSSTPVAAVARRSAAMVDYALMNQCLYEGKAKEVEQMTKDALAEGRTVQEVLNEGLIAGMSVVGEDFKHNVLYVPEVLIAARAMKAGMAVLKPLLTAKDSVTKPAGVLLMGTVRGDLHDIGKNLVCMMAEGAGFEVHDIGVDQSVEKFMAAADKCQAEHHRHERAAHDDDDLHEDGDRRLREGRPERTSRWPSAGRRSARCSPTKSAPTATAPTPRAPSICSSAWRGRIRELKVTATSASRTGV